MAFNEVVVLRSNLDFVIKSVGIEVDIQDATSITDDKAIGKLPTPGSPVLVAV